MLQQQSDTAYRMLTRAGEDMARQQRRLDELDRLWQDTERLRSDLAAVLEARHTAMLYRRLGRSGPPAGAAAFFGSC